MGTAASPICAMLALNIPSIGAITGGERDEYGRKQHDGVSFQPLAVSSGIIPSSPFAARKAREITALGSDGGYTVG
jgi:hypothetical protein